MKCPIDPNEHDCDALECYKKWPMDYPNSPCDNCGQKRINELQEKITHKIEFEEIKPIVIESIDEAKNINDLIQIVVNKIYQKGKDDVVKELVL